MWPCVDGIELVEQDLEDTTGGCSHVPLKLAEQDLPTAVNGGQPAMLTQCLQAVP